MSIASQDLERIGVLGSKAVLTFAFEMPWVSLKIKGGNMTLRHEGRVVDMIQSHCSVRIDLA